MTSHIGYNRYRAVTLGLLIAGGTAAVIAASGVARSRLAATPATRTLAASSAYGSTLVGTWELVSVATRWPDGRETEPWGKHPIGRLNYGADGRMWALLMDERRNQANGRTAPADVQTSAASYYATYAIDTVRHVVTHHVIASLRATEAGTIERGYAFREDTLILTAHAMYEGSAVTHTLYWLRNIGG